jgi:sugar/nucleoside kinase (ribokinase family)
VVAIGDAIVDVIATTTDEFLAERGLRKGSMQLLSAAEAIDLYDAMGPAREMSGGSAANSMAGLAAMGLKAGFIGKVAKDQLGNIFTHDIRSLGVEFATEPLEEGAPTGRCLILVTPDAQRTMNTCPGASHRLDAAALDETMIRSANIVYLEGYLWGPEQPRSAMLRAIQIAHEAGRTVAFTLSESVCMAGRRETFSKLIEAGRVDLLFANEDEAMQLTQAGSLEDAVAKLSKSVPLLVVTRGADGAVAIDHGREVRAPAAPAIQVVDTTGAGDLFAAGFLAARCRGHSVERCLETGAIAAAEVISHFGARPEADLRQLVQL